MFNHSAQERLFALIGLLAIWFASRPYDGIWHDSLLYTAQALRHLYPDAFSRDLFFIFGSQDDYTLFSQFYAAAIKLYGVDDAALYLTLIGQSLWLTSILLLARRLLSNAALWLGLYFALLANIYYGHNIFIYGEPFLTPRLFAESVVLISIALLLNESWLKSIILLILGLFIHPLVAIGGGLIFLVWLWQENKNAAAAVFIIGAVVGVVLTVLHIAPFTRLLVVMDEEWLAIVRGRSAHLLLQDWSVEDANRVLVSCSWLLLASLRVSNTSRRLFLSTLVATLLGLSLAFLAGDLLRNTLILQLQVWRVLWLSQLISGLALGTLVAQLLTSPDRWQRFAMLATPWLLIESSGGVAAILITAYLIWGGTITDKYHSWVRGLLLSLFVIGVLAKTSNLFYITQIRFVLGGGRDAFFLQRSLIEIIVGVALFIWVFRDKIPHKYIRLLPIIICGGLVWSIIIWDDRTKLSYFNKRDPVTRSELQQLIKPDKVVYWYDSNPATWLWLLRSSYVSSHQLAGVVFSRQTAIEGQRRTVNLQQMGMHDGVSTTPELIRGAALQLLPLASEIGLMRACKDPVLDYVILNKHFPGCIFEFTNYGHKQYLYDCAQYRSQG